MSLNDTVNFGCAINSCFLIGTALISVSLVSGWSLERGESPLSLLVTSNALKLLNRQEGLY